MKLLAKVLVSILTFSFSALGVMGDRRVTVFCGKQDKGFELDNANKTSLGSPLGQKVSVPKLQTPGNLWIKAEITDAQVFGSHQLNLRLQTMALVETVVEGGIRQDYNELQKISLFFNQRDLEAGKEWEHTFLGADYELTCRGKASIAPRAHEIGFSKEIHSTKLTGLDKTRIRFFSADEDVAVCGFSLESTLPTRKEQIHLLRMIDVKSKIGDAFGNRTFSFFVRGHEVDAHRINFGDTGTPKLIYSLDPVAVRYGLYLESGMEKNGSRRALKEVMSNQESFPSQDDINTLVVSQLLCPK